MNWITELLFNAGSGGLFGMLGTAIASWQRQREKKQDNEHQLALLSMQAQSAEALAAWTAFSASQTASASDMTERVSAWAANVRAVTRPFLTVFLVLGSFISVMLIEDPTAQSNAIQSFQFLAGTAVAWWFGSRMTTQMGATKK
jgi:hypothetical protein